MRRAICGATNAIKEIGPASAVAAAVRTTATSIINRRERSTLTPSAQAVSSPISSKRIRRTSKAAAINISTMIGAEGRVFAHVRPLSDPAFHKPAVSAVSKDAFSSSRIKGHQHGANADADNNQPKSVDAVTPCKQPDQQ